MRTAQSQPSFDLFSGAESTNAAPAASRSAGLKMSVRTVSGGEEGSDSLKAKVKGLEYKLNTFEQEREMAKVQHERELRDAQRQTEEEYTRKQAMEAERDKAVRKYEALVKQVEEMKDTASNEKSVIERRNRELEEKRRDAEEQVEEIAAERDESVRSLERKVGDLEARHTSILRSMEELQEEGISKDEMLHNVQQSLAQRESQVGILEGDVLRLKAQTGDADTLAVVSRELKEQVAHIRELEATNREQLAELKHFRKTHRSIEVVEEEKRSLQRKLAAMDDLEKELSEARLQRQRLEDERMAWTAYLQSEAGHVEFESPEDIARALVQERLQAAALVEKLGTLEPSLAVKDEIIKSLEDDKIALRTEAEKIKSSEGGDIKARARLERQRALAIKEVEFLRAQLKTFDTEETNYSMTTIDDQKVQRIQELEDMVDRYKKEVQSLNEELSAVPNAIGTKRPRDDSEDNQERLGELSRKTLKLSDEIRSLTTSNSVLKKELSVTKEQLITLKSHAKTRVLALNDNPTSSYEAIKIATLNGLRDENTALLTQLKGKPSTKVVPIPTLENAEREVAAMQQQVKDSQKHMLRLKQVWAKASAELKTTIASVLGWDATFMSNGRVKVESVYNPSDEDMERSIVFDGEKGTSEPSSFIDDDI